ncbi:MAG TPA: hypothetical protein VNE39_08225 [Planctomycetota bacterium]|nr:hypothetical protein [Planctomycetota bacterium]
MMSADGLLEAVSEATKYFVPKSRWTKFPGAVTVEILREALCELGFPVSRRDVFIRGVPVEVDLLIARAGAKPQYGLVYEPDDVQVVFEVKNYGSFCEKGLSSLKGTFERIRASNSRICCIYVSLKDHETYKWLPTTEKLGSPRTWAYTLFWIKGSAPPQSTGAWECLLRRLESVRNGEP